MSTKVTAIDAYRLILHRYAISDVVMVGIEDDSTTRESAQIEGADFIAAVEKELDGIFIRRADLPAVRIDGGEVTFTYGDVGHVEEISTRFSADELIALGLALKSVPPVDEADVEALASSIRSNAVAASHADHADTLARRLLATGRIEVKR